MAKKRGDIIRERALEGFGSTSYPNADIARDAAERFRDSGHEVHPAIMHQGKKWAPNPTWAGVHTVFWK